MVIVGPVLTQQGGYAFDVWTATRGHQPGFPYRRIDDAYYARRFEIEGEPRRSSLGAVICNTVTDFVAAIAQSVASGCPVSAIAAE